jgi:purine-nucleoside phosphorylase
VGSKELSRRSLKTSEPYPIFGTELRAGHCRWGHYNSPVNELAEALQDAVECWDAQGRPRPRVALVTGSALGIELGEPIAPTLPLAELVPFEVHAVEGHSLSAELYEPVPGRPLLYFRGRLHCYQGFDPHQVVFAVRLAALLGVEALLLTNAAGSLDPEIGPGALVALTDHLNLAGLNPLRGELPSSWGPRFPAMNDAYDPEIRSLAASCAEQLGFSLAEGVYAWLLGPTYETPAEIGMLRTLGASLVGMSTVPEVIAARQMGVRCFALSLVTNLAAGLTDEAPAHEEVVREGERAAARIADLIGRVVCHPSLLNAD